MTTDTYKEAKEQLDDIVVQVRKKDVSLEKSLDLLEEGVVLANRCTELIDQAAWDELTDASVAADADDTATEAGEEATTDADSAIDSKEAAGSDSDTKEADSAQ
ncbi:MAG: exodeoxyribonuclease VII small subunit [Coriobacteriia bacterium]|nr:exodeoxyribonuclease VII small subunit [Coriobacteriia bacterium]